MLYSKRHDESGAMRSDWANIDLTRAEAADGPQGSEAAGDELMASPPTSGRCVWMTSEPVEGLQYLLDLAGERCGLAMENGRGDVNARGLLKVKSLI